MATIPTDAAHIKYLPTPFLSSLVSDCVKRGRSVWDGGAVYDGGPVFCYIGLANIGNSLAAIRKLVFDDQVLTMAQLKHALETNFEDTSTDPTGPEIRQLCLAAPKFGNDDDYVDRITKDCFNIMVKELRGYRTLTGGQVQSRHRSDDGPYPGCPGVRRDAGRKKGRRTAGRRLFPRTGNGSGRADRVGQVSGQDRAHQLRLRIRVQHEAAPRHRAGQSRYGEVVGPDQNLLRSGRMGAAVQHRGR